MCRHGRQLLFRLLLTSLFFALSIVLFSIPGSLLFRISLYGLLVFHHLLLCTSKRKSCAALGLLQCWYCLPNSCICICVFFLQSVLLAEAEDRLNNLLVELDHSAHRSLSQYSAGDLETVVEVQLQLADIALQRHRAAYR